MNELDRYERVRDKSVKSSGVKNIKINGETYVNKKYLLSKVRIAACSSILGLSLVVSGITIGSAIKNAKAQEDTIVFDSGDNIENTYTDEVTPIEDTITDTTIVEEPVEEEKIIEDFENNSNDSIQENEESVEEVIQTDNIVEEPIENVIDTTDQVSEKEVEETDHLDDNKFEDIGNKTVDVIENTGEAITDYKNSDKFGAEFIRNAEDVAEDAGKKIIDKVGMDNIEDFGKKTVDVIENTGEAITDYKNSDKFGAEFIRDAENAVEDFGRDVIDYYKKNKK